MPLTLTRLTAEDIEAAFVAAAHEQEGGPFNWNRVAVLLNEKLADERYRHTAAFLLAVDHA